jgi:hypothetical protein
MSTAGCLQAVFKENVFAETCPGDDGMYLEKEISALQN